MRTSAQPAVQRKGCWRVPGGLLTEITPCTLPYLVQCCVLGLILTVGYMLKKYKFYYLPESAASMIVRCDALTSSCGGSHRTVSCGSCTAGHDYWWGGANGVSDGVRAVILALLGVWWQYYSSRWCLAHRKHVCSRTCFSFSCFPPSFSRRGST